MSKIELDKYYTPDDLAKYCVEKTKEIMENLKKGVRGGRRDY